MVYNSVSSIKDNTIPNRVNDFLVYLDTQEAKSEKTLTGYKNDLRMLFRFLKASKLNLTDVEVENVDISNIDDNFIKNITFTELCAFIQFLQEKGNVETTRARKIASIKTFYLYLQKTIELITISENIALKLKTPKIGDREPIFLTLEESKKLLNTIKYDINEKRDKCIVILLLNCGFRVSELCGINLDDIKENNLTVIGKGNKQRTVYLNRICLKSIDEYMEVRKEKGRFFIDEDSKKALFINKNLKRLGKKGVEELILKWVRKADLSEKITPHKLRHTAATLMLQSGTDISTIQEVLGHEDISTTQIYLHVNSESKRKAAEMNPLNNMI